MQEATVEAPSKLIRNLSIATTTLVAISTGINVWYSQKVNEALQDVRRRQDFSKQVLSQMDNLTGGNEPKSRLAMVGLFIVADDIKDKLAIANLALQSGKAGLRNTAADLISQDCTHNASDGDQGNRGADICRITLPLLAQASDWEQRANRNHGSSRLGVVVMSPVTAALEAATATKISETNLSGFIYMGKQRSDKSFTNLTIALPASHQAESAKPSALPESGEIKTITSVYIRNRSGKDGKTIGLLPKGTVLNVIGATRSKISGQDADAIWLRVSTRRSQPS